MIVLTSTRQLRGLNLLSNILNKLLLLLLLMMARYPSHQQKHLSGVEIMLSQSKDLQNIALCIDYAQGNPYSTKPWTRTSIDILIELVDKHREGGFVWMTKRQE